MTAPARPNPIPDSYRRVTPCLTVQGAAKALEFYTALFDRAVEREDRRAVLQEYAWDMGWCDPCAAQPMSIADLAELGAQWLGNGNTIRVAPGGGRHHPGRAAPVRPWGGRRDAGHHGRQPAEQRLR